MDRARGAGDGGVLRDTGGISLGINGTGDHVELLAKLARQKEHHAKVSFRDEFIKFLKVNGIEYDERYV